MECFRDVCNVYDVDRLPGGSVHLFAIKTETKMAVVVSGFRPQKSLKTF